MMDSDELADLRHLDHDNRAEDPCEWCGQYESQCHCEEKNGN